MGWAGQSPLSGPFSCRGLRARVRGTRPSPLPFVPSYLDPAENVSKTSRLSNRSGFSDLVGTSRPASMRR